MSEIDYLKSIYELLQEFTPLINLFVGCMQFSLVVFAVYILYKLFNLFF